jgi:hypothetical protein
MGPIPGFHQIGFRSLLTPHISFCKNGPKKAIFVKIELFVSIVSITYKPQHLPKMVKCTYMCMTIDGSKPIKIHVFTVDGISTYVIEPIGGNYEGWYDLFPSKRFDSLEEAMREVVELQQQPAFL